MLSADGSAEYEFRLRWEPDEALVDGTEVSALHIGSIAAFLQPGAAVVDSVLDRTQHAEATGTEVPDVELPAAEIPKVGSQGLSPGRSVLRTFDPNIRANIIGLHDEVVARFESLASRVDVVKLSDVDADWLYPGAAPEEQIDRILELGTPLVALTEGSAGSVLATTSARCRVPAETAQVRDTIGAGDSFMVSLIHDLHESSTSLQRLTAEQLSELGRRAAHIAAVTVARTGADLPWRSELPSP